jgi:hypothetical protein
MRLVTDSGGRYKKYSRTEIVITDPEGTIVLSQDIEEAQEGRDEGWEDGEVETDEVEKRKV